MWPGWDLNPPLLILWSDPVLVLCGGRQQQVATEDSTCGWSKLKCAVKVKYIPDFKDVVKMKKNEKYLIEDFYIGYILTWSI